MKACVILLSFLLLMPASAKDEQSEVTANLTEFFTAYACICKG
jgi:hypothetical protein